MRGLANVVSPRFFAPTRASRSVLKTNPDKNHNQELSPRRLAELKTLAERLELPFRDFALVDLAFTHSSFVNEDDSDSVAGDNERLEYLGDSVLGLVVNEFLYREFQDFSEGDLARIKSSVVSEKSLARIAQDLDIGATLKLGRGEQKSGGAKRPSNLADLLEALIAVIYLDLGLDATRTFIIRHFEGPIRAVKAPGQARDAKSLLQEWSQKTFHSTPRYEIIEESGPDHAKEFVCRVLINEREMGQGSGRSRKTAEQNAAAVALEQAQT